MAAGCLDRDTGPVLFAVNRRSVGGLNHRNNRWHIIAESKDDHTLRRVAHHDVWPAYRAFRLSWISGRATGLGVSADNETAGAERKSNFYVANPAQK